MLCLTLPHCRTAAHRRAHCHTLSSALPHTIAHTARTLPCTLPQPAARIATQHPLPHCRTLPRALPHTAAWSHIATLWYTNRIGQCCKLLHCRTAAHRRAHCHTLPRTLPHYSATRTTRTALRCALPHTARTAALPRTAAQILSIHINSYKSI